MKEKILNKFCNLNFKLITKLCVCMLILLQIFCARKTNFEKGIEAIKKGEYSKAIKEFNVALTKDSLNPEIYYNLCLTYTLLDSVNQSFKYYLKLTQLESDLKDDLQLREAMANFLNLEPYPSSLIPMPRNNQFKGSFSPDGYIIAVAAAKRDIADIYLIRLDGSIIKCITKGRMNTDPDFSPTGEHIVFVSDKEGDEELYLYNAKTKEINQLTHNTAQELSPSFSPDGNEIVFTSNMHGNWEIYKINLSNKKMSRLTKNIYWDLFPKFSNDGKFIVFSSKRNGSEDIYIMNKNGGSEKLLYSSPADDNDPTLFNNNLYFKSNQNGNWEIYQLNLKNKLLIRLTNNSYPDWNPRISKDGTKILVSRKVGKRWQLYFINLKSPVPFGLITNKIKSL